MVRSCRQIFLSFPLFPLYEQPYMSLYVLSYISICLYMWIHVDTCGYMGIYVDIWVGLYRHNIYSPICPLYIYSPLYEQPPIYTPLTGLGQWHEQRRTTHSYSYNLWSLASSCNWSCNQVYSHKSCQWSGKVVQLYDRRILRSATTMKDHQGFAPRPSHDCRTTSDD